ncbi:MAG: PIN domain-containing protein [Tepidisphaeraceae bacterium]
MGSIALPSRGRVYADAQILIYSVESHPVFAPLMAPLWQQVQGGALEVVSSELSILETLTLPLRANNASLITAYEQMLTRPGIHLVPITEPILRAAAKLRAKSPRLRTPDAIHVATAEDAGCALLLTNDLTLRGVGAIPAAFLNDVVK